MVLAVYVGSLAILATLFGLALHWTIDHRMLWLAAGTIAGAEIAAIVAQRLWMTFEGISVASGLIPILPRAGIPLFVAVVAMHQNGTTGRDFFGYIVFFYLATLPVSVLFSLPRNNLKSRA